MEPGLEHISASGSLLPHGQEYEQHDPQTCKYSPANQALNDNLGLELSQVHILDPDLTIENHEPRHHLQDSRPPREHARAVVKAFPGQWLPTRKQKKEETATADTRQDQAHAQPPKRPSTKHFPACVGAFKRNKSTQKNEQEADKCKHDA